MQCRQGIMHPGHGYHPVSLLHDVFQQEHLYADGFMKPLTDDKRKDVFIIDDSLFDRSHSKKAELLARVFDHCSMKYRSGFRILTLRWSDENSFLPVSHSLLSATENSMTAAPLQEKDTASHGTKPRISWWN